MLFYIEIPDDVVLDAAAQINAANEAKDDAVRRQVEAREIFFLTSDKPVSQQEVDNAISERTRRKDNRPGTV